MFQWELTCTGVSVRLRDHLPGEYTIPETLHSCGWTEAGKRRKNKAREREREGIERERERESSLEHNSCESRRPLADRPQPNEVVERCLSEPSPHVFLHSPRHSVFISLFAETLLPKPTRHYIYDTDAVSSCSSSLPLFISHSCSLLHFLYPEGRRNADNRLAGLIFHASPDSKFPTRGGGIMRN